MKIRLLVIGSRPDDWVQAGYEFYARRLPREMQLDLVEIPLATRSAGGDPAIARQKETERLLTRLLPRDFAVALDERGKNWSSVELSQQVARWQQDHPRVALLVGGPEGLTDEVRARANVLWSLSAMTFPHTLVRILVAEQLYRASTILKGHPYHKV
jgi:23S rRNA (pseudouridine1915-N3)-methyltransferase